MNKLLILTSILSCMIGCKGEVSLDEQSILNSAGGAMTAKLYQYKENKIDTCYTFSKNYLRKEDASEWKINVNSKYGNEADSREYEITFKNINGTTLSSSVGIEFKFSNWNTENYIMCPSALYDGNKYKVLPLPYPPYIYDSNDRKEDMPITITNVPHLNRDGSSGKVEMLTTNCSTPMMSFYNKTSKRGVIILTTENTSAGHSGFTITENSNKNEAQFIITAPGVREKQYVMTDMIESNDRAKDWNQGDSVVIRFKVYNIEATSLKDFYDRVFTVRKALTGQNEYINRAPFSKITETILNHHDKNKWFENNKYGYICNRPGGSHPFNHIQIGWGGIPTYSMPQLIDQTPERIRRIKRSLDAISKMQTSSGFFYGVFRDGEFFGDNFDEMKEKPSIAMIRKNGLALYFGIQHMEILGDQNVDARWKDMFKKNSDAVVKLWEDNGELGQFIDVESGKIEIRNSTSGAIYIGALTLASKFYNNPKYIETAEAIAKHYCERDLAKGYTGGGPAEILQCPDSESAAELAESLTVLYETTGKKEWLEEAKFATSQFATWVVSYDFDFPEHSDMKRVNAKSTGSVWASVQNEHSAPGIYVLSGDFLLKLFRATGDVRYAELLKDISHNVVQYVTTEDNPIGIGSSPGSVSERVNISDWEGENNIGMISAGDSNMAWETVALLSMQQNPGIYVQIDGDKFIVNDHVNAKVVSRENNSVTIEINNATNHDAIISILAETIEQSKQPLGSYAYKNWKKISVKKGETTLIKL